MDRHRDACRFRDVLARWFDWAVPDEIADVEASVDHSELFIALALAVGTDAQMVIDLLVTELKKYGFEADVFRLSDYLAEQADEDYRDKPFDEALGAAMTEGDKLRRKWERDDALALHAISDIVATREEKAGGTIDVGGGETEPANLFRHTFILRSLKTPDELGTLRAVYGPRLVVIGAYSPYDRRLEHLDHMDGWSVRPAR